MLSLAVCWSVRFGNVGESLAAKLWRIYWRTYTCAPPCVSSSRHKNAKTVDHRGVLQPEETYPRGTRRRQTDVGGSGLTYVPNFAINQAQRAKICLEIGREISTHHLKPNELYWVCLGWGQLGGVNTIRGWNGDAELRIVPSNRYDITFLEVLFYCLIILTLQNTILVEPFFKRPDMSLRWVVIFG